MAVHGIRVIVSWSTSGREITRDLVSHSGITQWLTELVLRLQGALHESDFGTPPSVIDGGVSSNLLFAATMRFNVEGSPFSTGPSGITSLIHGTRVISADGTEPPEGELRIQVTALHQLNVCEICGESSPDIPYTECRFCGVQNSYHHARCCMMNAQRITQWNNRIQLRAHMWWP